MRILRILFARPAAPLPASVYADRAARRDRHHRHPGRDPLPGLRPGARQGAAGGLPLQHEADRASACMMYVQDYDETLPPANDQVRTSPCRQRGPTSSASLIPYLKSKPIFNCPRRPGRTGQVCRWPPNAENSTNYMGNGVIMGRPLAVVPEPANIIYLHELGAVNGSPGCALSATRGSTASPGATTTTQHWYSNNHQGGGNLIFADGHANYRSLFSIHSSDFGLTPDRPHEPHRQQGVRPGAEAGVLTLKRLPTIFAVGGSRARQTFLQATTERLSEDAETFSPCATRSGERDDPCLCDGPRARPPWHTPGS